MNAVDCQGLAGALTLGVAEAGFKVHAKKELPGGFGAANVDRNRDLINPGIEIQIGPWEEWEVLEGMQLVFGNPPCSGFSLLNTSSAGRNPDQVNVRNHRGWDSPINDCMWALTEYGARTNRGRGPQYLIMESVQQAYKQGRQLMQMLRDRIQNRTMQEYDLTHLLVSGASTGAAQRRHRYYMVLTRRATAPTFRVVPPDPRTPATYRDALYDLLDMDWHTYEWQAYQTPPQTPFQHAMRVGTNGGVDGQFAPGPEVGTKHTTQVYHLLEDDYWEVGFSMQDAARKYYNRHGHLPPGFNEDQIMAKVQRHEPGATLANAESWHLGFHQPRRVPWDKEGYVITGSGGLDFIHPQEHRFLTIRETGRLQGFPDNWSWGAASSFRQAYTWIGKGVPVQTGRWVAEQVRASLTDEYEQESQAIAGIEIGDGERLIDVTNAWQGRVIG